MIRTKLPEKGMIGKRLPLVATAVATLSLMAACSGGGFGTSNPNPSGYTSGLVLASSSDLDASGSVGGPFDPPGSYTISNQGSQALQWSALASEPWIVISSTFGFLQVGESVTFAVTAEGTAADSLLAGSYSGSVTISDAADPSADIVRPAALLVDNSAAAGLSVTPASGFSAIGEQGGPFAPTSMVYTVSNTMTSDVNWDVSLSDTFVFVVGASSGVLSPGESTDVTLELDPLITGPLGVGVHSATATFSNTDVGMVATARNVTLIVQGTVEGWTEFIPSADTRIIYVSNNGSDSNDGLSTATPKRTIAAGGALLRDGFPDWLLLERGHTWTEQIRAFQNRSGRSTTEPMIVGAYGDEALPRPRISRNGNGFFVTGTSNYLALVSVAFDSAGYNGSGNPIGVHIRNNGDYFLVEDIYVEGFNICLAVQVSNSLQLTNLIIRRSVFVDSFSTDAHSQGVFFGISGSDTSGVVNGAIIEECFIDHCGWSDSVAGADPTIFNHNGYMEHYMQNITFRNCISTRASATGWQMRPGGVFNRNLLVRNPVAMNFGQVGGSSAPLASGVSGSINENVILEGIDLERTPPINNPKGRSIDLSNTMPGGNVTCSDNVIANCLTNGPNGRGLTISGEAGDPGDVHAGVNDLTVERNLVYQWYRAFQIMDGPELFSNVTVRDNDFFNDLVSSYGPDQAAASAAPRGISNPGRVTFDSNRYQSSNGLAGTFAIPAFGQITDLSGWVTETGETNAQSMANLPSYTDPNRNMESYRDLIEGTSGSTFDNWSNELRQQRKGNWRPEYMALPMINYIRDGFDLAPLQ